MFNWQYVGERQYLMEEKTGMCPTDCGEMEQGIHYVFYQSKEMKLQREKHKSILLKQLRAINTYPGVITAVSKAIEHG